MNSKRIKSIITIVVAIAVMIGMVIPTTAMEEMEAAPVSQAAEEAFEEDSAPAAEEGNGEEPEDGGDKAASEETDTPKNEDAQEQEAVPETIEEETAEEETEAEKREETGAEKQDLAAPFLPALAPQGIDDIIMPFADVVDWDETISAFDVFVEWLNEAGSTIPAPAGAAVTVVLMDKGPQNSYEDWTASDNRYHTSKNTDTMSAENNFNGWFQNIVVARSKKLVVSGVPEGYTVTFGDPKNNDTAGEYPYNFGDKLTYPDYYVNLTKVSAPAATLSSIAVTNPPNRTAYGEGESFNPSGMVVTAAYSDGTTKAIPYPSYSYSPSGALSASDNRITVSYTEGGITKTTTQAITVSSGMKLESISIWSPPTKTEYTEAEYFDPAGMVVTASYSNGTTKPVTGYTYSPTGALTTANNEINISYTDG